MTEPVDISSSLWTRTRRTAIEYLAVFIAAISFVFSTLAFAGLLMLGWVAYDANENAKISAMWVRELHADLKAQGFEPPPLEEEK